ncbi:MAG: FAD-dependent oxidoreductase, partial [Actinomycetota bacterium]
MSAPNRRSSTPRSALEEIAWPQLDERIVDTLRAAGERRRFEPGDVLFDVDAPGYDFHLIVNGSVDVIDRSDDHVVVTIEAGNFVGDLGMLMGQGTFLAAEACEATDAIVVPQQRLLELVATVPEVADVIVASFAARRRLIIEWGEGGLVIVGREADGATVALLEFVSRNRIGHRFVDASDRDAAHEVLASCGLELEALSEGPVVVVGRARALIAPSTLDLARAVGIDLSASDGEVVDVIVVGAGPGGLAAGVYAASEGLSTLVIEDTALGGQAGTSSRIENYLGFSTGISGAELAFQGGIQAVKFGARFAVPHRAVALRSFPDRFEIELADGTCVRGRAVVLACGVTYRRLPLDRLEELEGAGVYYAATELEARFTRGAGAVIVGGGNSAGQAAMFLSRSAGSTYIVVRGDGLSATMSSYLTQRIDADPDITLL